MMAAFFSGTRMSLTAMVMPERVAATDPFRQIADYTGSGPFRFRPDQWVPGSLAVYERFADYAPRDEPADFLAGGKRAHFDRVEWRVMPDAATAAAALQTLGYARVAHLDGGLAAWREADMAIEKE